MEALVGLLVWIAIGWAIWRWVLAPILRKMGIVKPKRARTNALEQEALNAEHSRLMALGVSHEARMATIERIFEAGNATLTATTYAAWKRTEQVFGQSGQSTVNVKAQILLTVSRNLVGMDNRDRTYLRVAEELDSAANGSEPAFRNWRAALLWGDGKGTAVSWKSRGLSDSQENNSDIVALGLKQLGVTVDSTISAIQQFAARPSTEHGNPLYAPILAGLNEDLHQGGGGSWLKSSDLEASPFAARSEYALRIGRLADGTPLTYSGDGSMVTVAPPGSGKTECNVLPSLLTWDGPAVVLDVSGELYERTAGWRSANVGPVYKFSPLNPEESHRFNPLASVRQEPDYVWEDSRLLAEMMIVPSNAADPFWENEARTVLTAAIANVCFSNPPDERPLHAVLDVLFGGAAWNEMLVGLSRAIDVRVMQQHSTALLEMNEKTRSSVLQTARSSLGAWTGERVAKVTAASDWEPEDLRSAAKPTVYICVRPNEMDAYLSVLRVFIGQHIRSLTSGDVPPHGSPPILFMLDELPRLKYMPPVDEALNIGRKYGLRLWMFSQSLGQFKESYPVNADGMLGACAVRIYMNPTGADGLAERISDELGHTDSIHDNSRKKLVEAVDLTGPKYSNLQIVLSNGGKPATVEKQFAYADPEFQEKMAVEAPSVHQGPGAGAPSVA